MAGPHVTSTHIHEHPQVCMTSHSMSHPRYEIKHSNWTYKRTKVPEADIKDMHKSLQTSFMQELMTCLWSIYLLLTSKSSYIYRQFSIKGKWLSKCSVQKHIMKKWSICKHGVCIILVMPAYDRTHGLRADDMTGHLTGQRDHQLGHLPQGSCQDGLWKRLN